MSTVPAGTTYTERSFPLSGGVKTNEAQQSPGNQAALDRVSSAGQMTEGTSNVPGDSFGYHTHSEKPHEGYVHHTSGPHASDIANQLDPHVPGEFPSEDGLDPHKSNLSNGAGLGAAGVGAAGLGAAGYGAEKASEEPAIDSGPVDSSATIHPGGRDFPVEDPSTRATPVAQREPEAEPEENHYGRNAALAGGAGVLGGAGAYEALNQREQPQEHLPDRTKDVPEDSAWPATGEEVPEKVDSRQAATASEQAKPEKAKPEKSKAEKVESKQAAPTHEKAGPEKTAEPEADTHDLRNAAIGGGAAAVGGAAAYEGLKSNQEPESSQADSTGSAWPTTGLDEDYPKHQTNQSQHPYDIGYPEGDWHQRDYVTPTPGKEEDTHIERSTADHRPQTPGKEEDTHDERNVAVAGAGGAAAYGGYKASHDDNEGRPSQDRSPQHKDHNKLHKSPNQVDRHEKELEKARQEQAEKGGDHGEKKHGLMHRIFHPHDKERRSQEGSPRSSKEYNES